MGSEIALVVLVGEILAAIEEAVHLAQVRIEAIDDLLGDITSIDIGNLLVELHQVAFGNRNVLSRNLLIGDSAPSVEKVGRGVASSVTLGGKQDLLEVVTERLHDSRKHEFRTWSVFLSLTDESCATSHEKLDHTVGFELLNDIAEVSLEVAINDIGSTGTHARCLIGSELSIRLGSTNSYAITHTGNASHKLQRFFCCKKREQQQRLAPNARCLLILLEGEFYNMIFVSHS